MVPLALGLVKVVADVVHVSSTVAVPTLSTLNGSLGCTYRLLQYEHGERGFGNGQVDRGRCDG